MFDAVYQNTQAINWLKFLKSFKLYLLFKILSYFACSTFQCKEHLIVDWGWVGGM